MLLYIPSKLDNFYDIYLTTSFSICAFFQVTLSWSNASFLTWHSVDSNPPIAILPPSPIANMSG